MNNRYVSGNDWWWDPSAPWNQPMPVYETCPKCEGLGGSWYNEGEGYISNDDYLLLSEEDKVHFEFITCDQCDGLGTIDVSM